MKDLEKLLKRMVEEGASDVHITVGTPPQMRVDEVLVPMEDKPLTPERSKDLVYSILTEAQISKYEKEKELDLSFGIEGLSRFRANVFYQKGYVAGAFRSIPYKIKSYEELGLPKIVNKISQLPKGLVLVTGATGSGKSTTLASIIDRINEERHCHIVTVEDPIEYVHQHKKSIVNQREVETDTASFARALKYVLRETLM
jgi:twitching motility protein PilT